MNLSETFPRDTNLLHLAYLLKSKKFSKFRNNSEHSGLCLQLSGITIAK